MNLPTEETVSGVSVILPCFNSAPYLESALDQLRRQSIETIEIIVVDDGSTDDTGQIARRFALVDDRIRLVSMPCNSGVVAAREAGVKAARLPWIWLVDADDQWPLSALESLLARSDDADVVIGAAQYIYEDRSPRLISTPGPGPLTGPQAFSALLTGDIKGHLWNKLFRRELFRDVSFTRSRVHSDLAMTGEALAAAKTVSITDDIVYRYKLRAGSIITSETPRAESLDIVRSVIKRIAETESLHLENSSNYDYFESRFILLSKLKDSRNAEYSPAQQAALVSEVRDAITLKSITGMWRSDKGLDLPRAVAVLASKMNDRVARSVGDRLNRR